MRGRQAAGQGAVRVRWRLAQGTPPHSQLGRARDRTSDLPVSRRLALPLEQNNGEQPFPWSTSSSSSSFFPSDPSSHRSVSTVFRYFRLSPHLPRLLLLLSPSHAKRTDNFLKIKQSVSLAPLPSLSPPSLSHAHSRHSLYLAPAKAIWFAFESRRCST